MDSNRNHYIPVLPSVDHIHVAMMILFQQLIVQVLRNPLHFSQLEPWYWHIVQTNYILNCETLKSDTNHILTLAVIQFHALSNTLFKFHNQCHLEGQVIQSWRIVESISTTITIYWSTLALPYSDKKKLTSWRHSSFKWCEKIWKLCRTFNTCVWFFVFLIPSLYQWHIDINRTLK